MAHHAPTRPSEESIDTITSDQRLSEQIELLLRANALGRSPGLERLLRYLEEQTRQGHSPKEIEIADALFARAGSNRDADASARVYLHRLRRKLDEFYAGPGASQPVRLALPKGNYRLVLQPAAPGAEPVEQEPAETEPEPRRAPRGWSNIALASIAALLLGLVIGWFARPTQEVAINPALRQSLFWAPVLDSDRRIALTLGDFYMFGEVDANGDVGRLIREFSIQSPQTLNRWVAADPALAGRYKDLGLTYLPISMGEALKTLVPMLTAGRSGAAELSVVPATQLNVRQVSSDTIVYLGYVSGLADMRYPVFGASRFAVGASYDEIVDRVTGTRYVGDSHFEPNQRPGEDYAIISSLKGPAGNRIVVIAGTRDAALMQAARFVADPNKVRALDAVARGGGSFEALIGVDSLENVGLNARLIIAARRPDPSWNRPVKLDFPDQMP